MSNSTSNKGLSDSIRAADAVEQSDKLKALVDVAEKERTSKSKSNNLNALVEETGRAKPASPRNLPVSPKITNYDEIYKSMQEIIQKHIENKEYISKKIMLQNLINNFGENKIIKLKEELIKAMDNEFRKQMKPIELKIIEAIRNKKREFHDADRTINQGEILKETVKNSNAPFYSYYNSKFFDDEYLNKLYERAKKNVQRKASTPRPQKQRSEPAVKRPSGKALKKRPISVKQQRLEEMHYLHDSIEKLIQSDRETTINNPIGVGKVEKDFNDIFRLIELRIAGKKINVDLNKLFDKTYSKFSIYFKNSHVLKDFNYYFKPALLRLINQVGERKRQYVPKVNCKPDEFRNFTNRCVKYDSELAHRLYKLNNYWTNSKHPLYGKKKKEKEQFQNLVNKYSDPEFKKTVTHFFGTDEGKKYLKTIENKHKERHEQRKQKTTDTPCPKYIRHIASNRCVQLTSTLQKKFEETPNLRNNYKWGEQ